jgi:hypothetical protein
MKFIWQIMNKFQVKCTEKFEVSCIQLSCKNTNYEFLPTI